jgi:hypothetical protein
VVRASLQEQHGKSSAKEHLTNRRQSLYLCDLKTASLRNSYSSCDCLMNLP